MSMRHEGWLHRLEARVEKLEERVKELEKQEPSDAQEVEPPTVKRGPGRPRNEKNA